MDKTEAETIRTPLERLTRAPRTGGDTVYSAAIIEKKRQLILRQAKIDSTTTTLSVAKMQERYEAASEPPDKPDYITTTETLFNAFHALLTPIQRFSDSETADAGYHNLLFRGAPVVEDSYCPASHMIFWNSKHVKLISHSKRKFPGEFIDFEMPINQDVMVAHIRWMGQLFCSQPRKQAAMTALTA